MRRLKTAVRVKALVFDLDDTLYPERDFVFSGFRAVGRWLKTHKRVHGFSEKAGEAYMRGERGRIFDAALTELQQAYDSSLITQLVRIYREHKPQLTLHPDARWALRTFRSHWKLGLLTDGCLATQERKVEALRLETKFDVILLTDSLGRGHWKPSELPYRHIMDRLGCTGNQCVYIGDNPAKDFLGAKALGWHTIQVIREDGEYRGLDAEASHRAQQKISSLFELEEIIR